MTVVDGRAVGERIREAMQLNGGMQQQELADQLLDGTDTGVTTRAVHDYLTGKVIPYRFMGDLERIFGRSTAWFLYGDADENTDDGSFEVVAVLLRENLQLAKANQELSRQILEQLRPAGPLDVKAMSSGA